MVERLSYTMLFIIWDLPKQLLEPHLHSVIDVTLVPFCCAFLIFVSQFRMLCFTTEQTEV